MVMRASSAGLKCLLSAGRIAVASSSTRRAARRPAKQLHDDVRREVAGQDDRRVFLKSTARPSPSVSMPLSNTW